MEHLLCVAIIIDLYFPEACPSPAQNFICSLVDVTGFRVLSLLGPFLFFSYMLPLKELLPDSTAQILNIYLCFVSLLHSKHSLSLTC